MTLRAWLDTVQCTAPWTVEDSLALYRMIHDAYGGVVDVYSHDGRVVYVRVEIDTVIERTIDVT